MDNLEYELREGAIIEKAADRPNCFATITDMVDEYDAICYPGVGRKMYRYIRNTDDRLKIVCHQNPSSVSENDRKCSFFLIAASKDDGLTGHICKNVCLLHSCMSTQEGEAAAAIDADKSIKHESTYLLGKKRKAADAEDACRESWKVLTSDRYFRNEQCVLAKNLYFEDMGVYESLDLRDLDPCHVEKFAILLKDVPGTKLRRLLMSNQSNKK